MAVEKGIPENVTLTQVLPKVLSLPGVKVDRKNFLAKTFSKVDEELRNRILDEGPVHAGIPQKDLKRIANNIVTKYTWTSTGASFLTGLPGGPMGITLSIPADTAQFLGIALRLAQEISYLYGAEDLWNDNTIDLDAIMNRFMLYCGVMFGVGGAAATMRVAFVALSKQALTKLPQKALTKTVYFQAVRSIARIFGAKMTKSVFAKGVSRALPVLGGVASGGLTFVTMKPMGKKLVDAFETLCFNYSDEMLEQDVEVFEATVKQDEESDSSSAAQTEDADPMQNAANEIDTDILTSDVDEIESSAR